MPPDVPLGTETTRLYPWHYIPIKKIPKVTWRAVINLKQPNIFSSNVWDTLFYSMKKGHLEDSVKPGTK